MSLWYPFKVVVLYLELPLHELKKRVRAKLIPLEELYRKTNIIGIGKHYSLEFDEDYFDLGLYESFVLDTDEPKRKSILFGVLTETEKGTSIQLKFIAAALELLVALLAFILPSFFLVYVSEAHLKNFLFLPLLFVVLLVIYSHTLENSFANSQDCRGRFWS